MNVWWSFSFGLVLVLGFIGCATDRALVELLRPGMVLDSQHHPVADATVEIYRHYNLNSSPAWNTALEETLHTDAQGQFQFSDTNPPKIIVVHKAGLAPVWRMTQAAIRGDSPESFVLDQPQDIAGKVRPAKVPRAPIRLGNAIPAADRRRVRAPPCGQ